MKRQLRRMIVWSVLIGLMATTAMAERRSIKETWNDSLISSRVKYRMARDPEIQKGNMNVDVTRGVVTITGRATSENEKNRVTEVAGSIKGVTEVANNLKVVAAVTPEATAIPVEVAEPVSAPIEPVAAIRRDPPEPPSHSLKPAGHKTLSASKSTSTPSSEIVATDLTEEPAAVGEVDLESGEPALPATPDARPAESVAVTSPPVSEPVVVTETEQVAPAIETMAVAPANSEDPEEPMVAATTTTAETSDYVPTVDELMNVHPDAPSTAINTKQLPWYGEDVADEESTVLMHTVPKGSKIKIVKREAEFSSEPTARTPLKELPISSDADDLARRAAEELRKLRGN